LEPNWVEKGDKSAGLIASSPSAARFIPAYQNHHLRPKTEDKQPNPEAHYVVRRGDVFLNSFTV
jgi:hypothetical protein